MGDRTFVTLVLALVLMGVMGWLRPDKAAGMYPKKYWATKIRWSGCADAVITGDSRALMGLSPQQLQKHLRYDRIFNFAFGANWYSGQYLEAVERVFDPSAREKAVFMGITPHSLTFRKHVMGHFMELGKMSDEEAFLDIHLAALVNFFEPMSFRDALFGLFPSMAPTHTRKAFMPDGWVAVHKTPGENDEVKRYRGIFRQRQVSEDVIAGLRRFVSGWTQRGIKVYGFAVPTCSEMVAVEESDSGFDEKKFVEEFEAAGGKWIAVDKCRYYSFDGSHLQDDAAVDFSNDLAALILQIEQADARSAGSGPLVQIN